MNLPASPGNYEVRLFPGGSFEPIARVPVVATPSPELLIQPTMWNNSPDDRSQGVELREACLNQTWWPTARFRSKFFGNAVWIWEQWTVNSEVQTCLNNLHAAGISLVIAGGSLRPFCFAHECWEAHRPTIERLMFLKPAGMKVFIEIDEPLTHGEDDDDGAPYGVAVTETVEYIRLIRSHTAPHSAPGWADIGIFLAEAYPAQTVSILKSFFADVHSGAIAATGRGIEYAMIDHDWNDEPQGPAGVADVVSIGEHVRSLGIKAAVAFWDASPAMFWHEALMHQGLQYRNNGWEPDVYYVSNWTGQPRLQTPEWWVGTFMRSLRDFVNTYLPLPTSVRGLRPREFLGANDYRMSPDGRFTLTFQADGNLVLRGPDGVLFQTGTVATYPRVATWVRLESSGNLVVYHNNTTTDVEEAVWTSNTAGFPGAYLVVQSDGNLVLYYGRIPIWSSNTDSY